MGLGLDAYVVQYLPTAQVWRTIAAYCQGGNGEQAIGYEIPDVDNPFAAQLKQGEVIAIADTQAIADPVNQTVAQAFPGAWLLTPLQINGQLWGSLTLMVPNRSHPWSAAEISMVRAVAAQLEVAIHQANFIPTIARGT